MNLNKNPAYWRKINSERKRYVKECNYCGKAFDALKIARFCCESCRRKSFNEARQKKSKAKFFKMEGDTDQ